MLQPRISGWSVANDDVCNPLPSPHNPAAIERLKPATPIILSRRTAPHVSILFISAIGFWFDWLYLEWTKTDRRVRKSRNVIRTVTVGWEPSENILRSAAILKPCMHRTTHKAISEISATRCSYPIVSGN